MCDFFASLVLGVVGLGLILISIIGIGAELIMETKLRPIVWPASIANLHRVCLIWFSGGMLLLLMLAARWLGLVGG